LNRQNKVAIIAALERELHPLVRTWAKAAVQHDGRTFTFYESNYAVAICGGIGADSARRAAEAAIKHYAPEVLISAGVAGALVSDLHVGDTIFPLLVIDTKDGSRRETAIQQTPMASSPLARTVVATYSEITTIVQKQQLAKSYAAHAVDMEASAVALAAEKHGLPFIAIKAISDDLNFELPEMNEFIRDAKFRTAKFVFHVTTRPWLWLRVYRLARNTKLASENLCAWLRESALTNTIVPVRSARAETSVPPNI
jgi:adenosylhomocysteine nucleosidase